MDQPDPPRDQRTFLSALAVYTERSALVMVALGFSAGLPYFLDLRHALGLAARVGALARGHRLLQPGHARLELQVPLGARSSTASACPSSTAGSATAAPGCWSARRLIILGLWLVAGSDPARSLGAMAVFAVLVGFASATQDIAIDAWRIEVADTSRQGAMAAAYQWGYRVAIIVAGAVPLLLAGSYGWNFSYAVMAALMGIGVLAVLAAPREAQHADPPDRDRGHRSRARARGDRVGGAPRDPRRRRARAGVGPRRQRRRARQRARRPGPAGAARRGARRLEVRRARLGPPRGRARRLRRRSSWPRSPLPGARTRPGVYLSSALADPLRDFFARHRSTRRPHPRAHLPLPHPRLRAEHHEPVLSRPRLHAGRDRRGAEDLRRRR